MARSKDPQSGEPTHGSGRRDAELGAGSEDHKLVDPAASKEAKGEAMPDDKANRGQSDRSRVAAEQQYEVAYFAKKHGLTSEEAEMIIRDAGPSRQRADELASRK